jgi:hypothetical protein
MNGITTLSPQQLRRAADIQERILSLKKELSQILGAPGPAQDEAAPKKRRRMSRAGRAAIAAAARARWAAIKGAKAPGASVRKRKRKLSAAGREALSLAAKARWRIARAKGKTTL